jgi:hypothetical protein
MVQPGVEQRCSQEPAARQNDATQLRTGERRAGKIAGVELHIGQLGSLQLGLGEPHPPADDLVEAEIGHTHSAHVGAGDEHGAVGVFVAQDDRGWEWGNLRWEVRRLDAGDSRSPVTHDAPSPAGCRCAPARAARSRLGAISSQAVSINRRSSASSTASSTIPTQPRPPT